MRTIEEHSVVLPPVSCAAIAHAAGQTLIVCQDGENEIVVRDYLFTPFGLTATLRFDANGAIVDKKMSAGSWHDLLDAAIEALARRAGIDTSVEEDWSKMAAIHNDWATALDDGAILADLLGERIYVIPNLQTDQPLLERILAGAITMEEAMDASISLAHFDSDQTVRKHAIVLDDAWSMDEEEIDEAIEDAREDDAVVLFGLVDGEDQFLHTIGLNDRGWPEIVVRDLDPHLSPYLLRRIVATHEDAGVTPRTGRIPDSVMPGGLRLRFVSPGTVKEEFPRALSSNGMVLEVDFPL